MKLPMNRMEQGLWGVVREIRLTGSIRRRLQDLGLICGTVVSLQQKSPAGDPAVYWIRGTLIALRKVDAEKILVELEELGGTGELTKEKAG